MTFIEELAKQNLYTFDDQIVFALAILRTNPEILREYQRYFEHVIIDELQDFSPAKVELLMLLCEKHANIMAFGDIFQEVQFDTINTKGRGIARMSKLPPRPFLPDLHGGIRVIWESASTYGKLPLDTRNP